MCTILLQNRALWVISLMHCGNSETGQLIHHFTLYLLLLMKISPRIDSNIGLNERFRLMTFYPEAATNMHL